YYIQSYWSLPFEKVTRIFFSGNDGLSFRLFCELEEPKGFKTGIISGDTMHLATFMDNRIYRFDVSKITKEMVTSTNPTMAHSFPSFNLYPSVASTEITVDIGPVINKPATLWIIDNLGRQVLLNEIFGNESRNPVQVNIQSLEPGIYYAILNYNGKNSSRKFIKE
ncbi:MAG: T9SS type A sorting domain-containing protein, partial [Bacteroidia bacterium]|nr:T9SS type A sorting domain-containing protein [Bacteroidia bacterium]